MLIKSRLSEDYGVLSQWGDQHQSSQFRVVLNRQAWINGMGDQLFHQVSVKAFDRL